MIDGDGWMETAESPFDFLASLNASISSTVI
jgi:hypothetical protein